MSIFLGVLFHSKTIEVAIFTAVRQIKSLQKSSMFDFIRRSFQKCYLGKSVWKILHFKVNVNRSEMAVREEWSESGNRSGIRLKREWCESGMRVELKLRSGVNCGSEYVGKC